MHILEQFFNLTPKLY